jgi:hypothetical protein
MTSSPTVARIHVMTNSSYTSFTYDCIRYALTRAAFNPFTVGFIFEENFKSTKHSSNYNFIIISLPELPGSQGTWEYDF